MSRRRGAALRSLRHGTWLLHVEQQSASAVLVLPALRPAASRSTCAGPTLIRSGSVLWVYQPLDLADSVRLARKSRAAGRHVAVAGSRLVLADPECVKPPLGQRIAKPHRSACQGGQIIGAFPAHGL